MLNRVGIGIVVLGQLLCAQSVQAIWFRSESVEWKTDAADAVVIVTVTGTEAIDPLNPMWDSQLVSCQVVESVKGEWEQEVSFRQDYQSANHPSPRGSPAIQESERLLVFFNSDGTDVVARSLSWFNLTSPIPVEKVGPLQDFPYDNEGHPLTDEAVLLQAVRARTALSTGPKRGLIVGYPTQPGESPRDYYHDFVITAEPEYRQRFVDQLQAEHHETRCAAIYNLISYPGEETEQLLRAMLDDPAQETVELHGPARETITYYPVRQAVYEALTQLGADCDPPDPYYPDVEGTMVADTGFENEAYFPCFDWTAE